MLSTPGNAVRPRVTEKPACERAELTIPASAKLRVTQAPCAVFQAGKRVGDVGGSEDANR